MGAKPTIIFATSNGIGMGHLARATAISKALKSDAEPIIVSMASGIAEIPDSFGFRCEYLPGEDRQWMSRSNWDFYIRDRITALIDETNAKVIVFDGVIPHAGFIAARNARPGVKLVWMRRGLWQKKIHRFALPLQSSVMDLIIEPGDYAFAYDHGPTSKRTEALRSAPVSLYQSNEALDRESSMKALGLDPNRPAVLVQLGTGADDANQKMTAALNGLKDWPNLQVVLTKEPIDKEGNSLAPEAIDLRVVRFFPLANVLAAFDAAVCATGYNGVHELLAAAVPTVFVSNIRGMDDQDARAKWCHDLGYALRANHADLSDIENQVKKLQDVTIRESLSKKCRELPAPIGGEEIARKLVKLIDAPGRTTNLVDQLKLTTLRFLAIGYRQINPRKVNPVVSSEAAQFSDETSAAILRGNIKSERRFEQMISGASDKYKSVRKAIADTYYN
jgi:spore coat polysaccharide biosynthesis predicted glycosyltransferase SpsG